MKLPLLKMLAGLLLVASSVCQGTTFTVLAGTAQNGFIFSPKDTPINSGDTVMFKYNAGPAHNVVADDNSFTSGNVSTGWTFSKTFTNTGTTPLTVPFYCVAHGQPGGVGMAGTITVAPAAVTPSIKLGGYLSGNWFNPNQGGHGFQFEFTNISTGGTTDLLVAIWFVYTPTGAAPTDNSGNGQNWIYASGSYDTTSNTVTVPAILQTGAKFPPNFNPADVRRITADPNDPNKLWGHITFTFTDCNNGTVSWHSDVPGYNNQNDTPLAIQRLTQIAGTTCPQ